MALEPRVFTIPASAPFLPTLIAALMEDRLGLGFKPGGDPLALASATIYLPTRRACRLAHRMFLDVLKRDAAILPRIVPIGDVDEDELAFAEAATGENTGAALDLPEALTGLSRAVPLAEIILKWAETIAPRGSDHAPLIANSPAAALALAQDLARLMDDMTTRQVSWDRLDGLVPDELDKYWEHTLDFLKFIRRHWPEILKERGCIEPAERRDKLIAAEARRLETSAGPVIAAGSTGSIPATATLLATIAKLPHGALVLPGLDTDLDEATWRMIASRDGETEAVHGHPQFAMQALLARIGIVRDAVKVLGRPATHGRERLASEALRPAAASELWQQRLADADFVAHADAAIASVAVIEAANAEEEALAIAVALREAMNEPDKTAALVTPDRALARRVLAALARWNVPVDDSGGDALSDTPAGVFARLTAEAALEGLPPVTLLALLKHPSCRFDAAAISTLERAILRGPRPKRGTAGLEHALQTFRVEHEKFHRKEPSSLHRSDPRTAITDSEFNAAVDLVAKLKAALAPLESLPPGPQTFSAIAGQHAKALVALGGITEELAKAFDEIAEAGALPIEPRDYIELFRLAIADRPVRRPEADVRVRIYGPLEARLQSVDRLVLGGLVEGVWPPETRGDPWLSRPMRHELGLDLPERRIGLSAHDFAQALGAPEVILSRAARQGGAPTVASRFVQRLAAVAGAARWDAALARGARYAALARRLDETATAKPAARPAPKPPLAARPRQLSVTEIEHWLRDPYTIYAKHVLKLQPLDDIDTPPGAADRGTLIHDTIGEFAKTFPQKMPDDPVGHDRDRRPPFRAAVGLSGGARVLVAALPAHRRMVRGLRDRPARQALEVRCRDRRPDRNSVRQRDVHADGARRPHRVPVRRPLRHPRLQDRRAADRAAGPHRAVAAAHARSRDPAQGRLQGHPRRRVGGGAGLCAAARRRRARRRAAGQVQGRAPPTSTPITRWRGSPALIAKFADPAIPISRCCIRCGRRTTAPTTISRACRNGR